METLPGVLRRWAADKPEDLAFLFLQNGEREGARLTFAGLHRQALAIAARLTRYDLADRPVMLIYPSGLDYIAAFFGCLCAAVIAVPAPYLLPKRAGRRIAAIARDSRPAAVLTLSGLVDEPEIRDATTAELAGVPWIATDGIAPGEAGPDEPRAVNAAGVAFLQYTSGSTGAPRGAVISHGNLMANQAMIQSAFGHDATTRFVSWLPMFHDMGLVGTVIQPLYLGVPCVQMSPLAFLQRPVRWLRALSTYRGTTSGAPNFAFDLCARMIRPAQREGLELSAWRVAFCGAEPVRAGTLSRFAEIFAPAGFRREALYPCYGMSEATLFATGGVGGGGMTTLAVDGGALADRGEAIPSPPASPRSRTLVSNGRSWGEQRLAIVDPDTCRAVPPGRVGEIWLAGPHVGLGYWQRPEATAATFDGRMAEQPEVGYLRTGDLGFLRDGDLFVTGRLKDLLIVRGAKHHPEEIEQTLAASHPALATGGGAVFSVDQDGEPRVVVLHEIDRRHLARLDAGVVARAAFGAVSETHGIWPDDLVLLRPGALPRTTSGKVQRHRCREAYLAGDLAALPMPPLPGPTRRHPGEAEHA
jgi:acyl-CoA synthetase (AMP-forming)/AMP-acid ligase II